MTPSKRSSRKSDVRGLLDRLADDEQAFLTREFLAPAVAGGSVRVRIGPVVCKIAIEPRDFVGWGVFQPISHTHARLVRQASLAEQRRYLELFPLVRLIMCRRAGDVWYGSAASFGDARIQLDGMAPVLLAEEVQLFDPVHTRYDGTSFWLDEIDSRHDPAAAAYLRQALAERTAPEDVARKGLTAEERAAYEVNYWQAVRPAEEREPGDSRDEAPQQSRSRRRRHDRARRAEDPTAARLEESLSHAGANLVGYFERGDSFRVTYRVGGQQYTTAVDKRDLAVQVAGICLSGEDQKFDLASLVGVLREAEQGYGVVRIGDEGAVMREEDYWRVHPRQR